MRSTVLSGPALVTPFFVLQILAMSDYTVEESSIGMAFGKFSQNNFVLAALLMKKAKLPGERYHDRSLDY